MSAASQLPNEPWLDILQLAIHVPALLSPKIHDESVSPWIRHHSTTQSLQTRKAIVQVCRAWWILGVELLYEYISVSTPKEIESLVECFEHSCGTSGGAVRALPCPNKEGYAWWTKRVDIRSDLLVNKDVLPVIRRLIASCHNVRVIDITPATTYESVDPQDLHDLVTLAADRFAHSFRRFSFNFNPERIAFRENLSYQTFIPDLPLDTIDIQFNNTSVSWTKSINQEQIRALDTVSTLGLSLNSSISSFPAWRCPSLRHLKFMYIVSHDVPVLKPFLQMNGEQITSLTLFIGGSYRFDVLDQLLPHFPNLRSLGYNPINVKFVDSQGILSTSITTLRLTLLILDGHIPGSPPDPPPKPETLKEGITEAFPGIETVRIEDGPWQRLTEEASMWKTFIPWCQDQTYQVLDADGYLIPR